MQVAGSTCLVTGATSGIGRAAARLLAARGARLVVTGPEEDELAATAHETGGRAILADLTDPGAVEHVAAEAGEVDVVVHAAGQGHFGATVAMPPDRLEYLVALNVTAPIALTVALLPGMLERGRGHIVVVGSIAGRVGRGRETAYAATKAAISVFADSLRAELRDSGVGVSVVTPAVVDTLFFERRGRPYDRSWPRPVPPARVAAAILDAIESDRAEVLVPRWLSVPVRLRGASPALFRGFASRFD